METFCYMDNEASPSRLRELRQAIDDSVSEQKYDKYKAWLHYANLDRWRSQGHHFFYMTIRKGKTDWMVCTCGLSVSMEGDHALLRISAINLGKVSHLNLDALQTIEGHRAFKEKIPICALITSYTFVGRYLWSAYCQVCGEIVNQVSNQAAKRFTHTHNTNHLGTKRRKI